jgi:hypothetical protein
LRAEFVGQCVRGQYVHANFKQLCYFHLYLGNVHQCGFGCGFNQQVEVVRNALSEGAALAAPSRAGRRGHPVGFASHYRDELLALQGDNGARRLLERDRSKVVEIKIDDAGIFADIDIRGDLKNL